VAFCAALRAVLAEHPICLAILRQDTPCARSRRLLGLADRKPRALFSRAHAQILALQVPAFRVSGAPFEHGPFEYPISNCLQNDTNVLSYAVLAFTLSCFDFCGPIPFRNRVINRAPHSKSAQIALQNPGIFSKIQTPHFASRSESNTCKLPGGIGRISLPAARTSPNSQCAGSSVRRRRRGIHKAAWIIHCRKVSRLTSNPSLANCSACSACSDRGKATAICPTRFQKRDITRSEVAFRHSGRGQEHLRSDAERFRAARCREFTRRYPPLREGQPVPCASESLQHAGRGCAATQYMSRRPKQSRIQTPRRSHHARTE
jgi:hypothetical protein